MAELPTIQSNTEPPNYCQYADGPCDQSFDGIEQADALFFYPSKPSEIAGTIEAGIDLQRGRTSAQRWVSWTDLPIEGQVIFCEICKASRFANAVVADVTTLNHNVAFEIGYAIGLSIPVIPIRDTGFAVDKARFDELGLLDTLGFLDFSTADQLAQGLSERLPTIAPSAPPAKRFTENPLYVVKESRLTEGTSQLLSTLKKAALKFRAFDPVETPRLTLFEAQRHVAGSVGIVANLLSSERPEALVHNARCALIAGMAMAKQKVVVLLQPHNETPPPIDYRDVVRTYSDPRAIPTLLESSIRQIVESLQRVTPGASRIPTKLLERLDLGNTAAENEIVDLREYFVRTGQFREALRGRARLAVGRKGAGKTALFYEIRNAVGLSRSTLMLDLRPEGDQFTRLRETILENLSPGLQQHLITAFWNYILLVEMTHSVVRHERRYAALDDERLRLYENLKKLDSEHVVGAGEDLPQRLRHQVARISRQFADVEGGPSNPNVTEILFGGDIRELDDAVTAYVAEKDEVWLLIDNLDKGWPTRGTTETDILILRGLLEATRKLQRQFEKRSVDFRCNVFVRTDVYEHLLAETPDKGKDTPVRLDWDDGAVLEEIIRSRIEASTGLKGDFRVTWREIAESHIGAEDSFNYMLERTLMRPRDVITFVQRAQEVALNRGNSKIQAADIKHAESSYSEDLLMSLDHEMRDTEPLMGDVLYAFLDSEPKLSKSQLEARLVEDGVPADRLEKIIELLLWFGFLGVQPPGQDEVKYSYQVRYNLKRLTNPLKKDGAQYVVHPAFRASLEVRNHAQTSLA